MVTLFSKRGSAEPDCIPPGGGDALKQTSNTTSTLHLQFRISVLCTTFYFWSNIHDLHIAIWRSRAFNTGPRHGAKSRAPSGSSRKKAGICGVILISLHPVLFITFHLHDYYRLEGASF